MKRGSVDEIGDASRLRVGISLNRPPFASPFASTEKGGKKGGRKQSAF